MTISFSLTATQVIQYAFQKMGVIRGGGAPSANELAEGIIELDAMLKQWAAQGPFIFTKALGNFPLLASTAKFELNSQTVPVPALRIIQANYQDANDREIPMFEMSRDDYFNLPIKNNLGIPTQYFFDPQPTVGEANFYVWPMLASVTIEQINMVYQRRISDAVATSALDIPQEWLSTVGYNLAVMLLPNYGLTDDSAKLIVAQATQLKQQAMDYDRDDLIQLKPDSRWRA